MIKHLILILLFGIQAGVSVLRAQFYGASSAWAERISGETDRLFFIENKGQWHEDVLFLCRMGGLDAWITKYGVNYTFYKTERVQRADDKKSAPCRAEFYPGDLENQLILGHRVIFELGGRNPNPSGKGLHKLEGYHNYFIGNDPARHATNVGLYKEVLVKDVYTGIDVRYYFEGGCLRYDFIVHPDADPDQIRFALRGQYDNYTKNDSRLCFTTRFGEVQMTDLNTYQEGYPVASRFKKIRDSWQFHIDAYDKSKTLVIDPLIYSTYIGGSGNDISFAIAVDNAGNAYITGNTVSVNYDVTPGAFQVTLIGGTDGFVTKVNPSGSALIYSTYFGGSGNDFPYGIAVDAGGNTYVTGFTTSGNFNTTPGVFQSTLAGGSDGFVTKFNPSGTALIYSTYFGGSMDEFSVAVAVDNNGNAYVTGETNSTNFDITPGAFQTVKAAGYDGFVTKVNPSGSALIYSTYLGGNDGDYPRGIAVDAGENAYVTGGTTSSNFSVTPGAFQTVYSGGPYDVFVTKFNPSGTALDYSTYLGGSGDDISRGIVVDNSGNAYLTGETNSNNYNIVPGAFQTSLAGARDGFVTKLNPSGTALIYSSYLGGSGDDIPRAIAIDDSGKVYVTGETNSTNFSVTPGSVKTTYTGGYDVFMSKLNPSGTTLVYSTYLGGSSDEYPRGIAVDNIGNAYITGRTGSGNYDVTAGAFRTAPVGGAWDAFVTKICTIRMFLISPPGSDNQNLCLGDSVLPIQYETSDILTVSVSGLPNGVTYSFLSDLVTISGTPTVSGIFNYSVTGTGLCGDTTLTGTITVHNLPNVGIIATPSAVICQGSSLTLSGTGALSYTWSGGISDGVPFIPTVSGTYTVTGTDVNGCTDTSTVNVSVVPHVDAVGISSSPSSAVCAGSPVTLTATGGGTAWNWSNGETTSEITVNPGTDMNYSVTVTNPNACSGTATAEVTINVNSLPSVSITGNLDICLNESTTLTAAGGSQYQWNTGSTSDNITVNPAVTTIYTVTVTDTNDCTNSASATVTVNPLPQASFTSNEVCEGEATVLTNTSSVSSGSLIAADWSISPVVPAGNNSVTHTFPSGGTYPVTLNVTSDKGCSSSVTQNVTVHYNPVVSITSDVTNGCEPLCVNFTDQSTVSGASITGWSWKADNQAISSVQNPNHCFQNDGIYDIQLDVFASNGCSSSHTYPGFVTVFPSPTAAFETGSDSIPITSPTIFLINQSLGGSIYQWNFGDGSISNEYSPSHTYNAVGEYCIELAVSSPDNGCVDLEIKCIKVYGEHYVYIPNSFTPDGDQLNEIFKVRGYGIQNVRMWIFDRWGRKLYYTDDQDKGWDGTVNNSGEPLPVGVYIYKIRVTNHQNQEKEYLGSVNLIR